MSVENVISVKILDRLYKIRCTPKEAIDLQEAAHHVDDQMRKLKQAGHIPNTENMAVVAALNIYNEFLQLKKEKNQCIDAMNQRIIDLQRKIEEKLVEKDSVIV